ncbi:MAG TPA: exosortase V [Caulobacteraceae bacterium]|nr:exosortase V [Caulobacteraceae bacterium]
MAQAAIPERAAPALRVNGAWLLAAGLLVLGLPTAWSLKDQVWSHDFGAYGPIILAAGGWLLWREAGKWGAAARPGPAWATALILLPSLGSYVFGRAYDYITLETAGVYGVFLAMLWATIGPRLMVRHWFPLLYLALVIPPPNSLLDSATAPLKQFVTWAATSGLAHFGVPVAREGVTIFVAQYQLLVEDACSGMNSIVGLTAVSLLYVYLMRGSSLLYSLALTAFVIPIAIVANIVRIVVLVLLTYFFGDAVAQSFLHFTAGMLLFATALLLVFALDRLFAAVLARRRRASA